MRYVQNTNSSSSLQPSTMKKFHEECVYDMKHLQPFPLWLLIKFLCLVKYKNITNSVKLFCQGLLWKQKKVAPLPWWPVEFYLSMNICSVTISDIYYLIIGAKRINIILSLFRYLQKIGRKCHQSNSYFNFICCLFFVLLLLLFSNKLQSKYECRKVAKSFIHPYLYKIFALPGCHGLLTQYYHMCFINMISTWYYKLKRNI